MINPSLKWQRWWVGRLCLSRLGESQKCGESIQSAQLGRSNRHTHGQGLRHDELPVAPQLTLASKARRTQPPSDAEPIRLEEFAPGGCLTVFLPPGIYPRDFQFTPWLKSPDQPLVAPPLPGSDAQASHPELPCREHPAVLSYDSPVAARAEAGQTEEAQVSQRASQGFPEFEQAAYLRRR